MQQKEATCLRCEFKKSFTARGGSEMFVFIVQFDNGDTGEFVTTKNPQDYFTVNQRSKYLLKDRSNDGYPPDIKAIRENNSIGGRGGARETPQEREDKNRQIVAQSSVKAAIELISSGKVRVEQMAETAKKIFDITYSISNGDTPEQIVEKYRKKEGLKTVS
ncbi:hypothetical protein [Croceimicrobium sp.]|uniref:hypothetical protein n=1 Tax=Croceimicrobium sp. TaxID=2828340 RepID=UPI003BA874DB